MNFVPRDGLFEPPPKCVLHRNPNISKAKRLKGIPEKNSCLRIAVPSGVHFYYN